jgi:hypothetical protein
VIAAELERRGVYDPQLLPPAPDRNRSRFALVTSSPSGIARSGAANLGGCALLLAEAYKERGKRALPKTVTVQLQELKETVDGDVVLVAHRRSPVTGVPVFVNQRPTKLGQLGGATPAEVIDTFLLQESPGWTHAVDAAVFEAACSVANSENLRGEARKNLSDALCRLVAMRAGLLLGPDVIP